MFGIASFDIDLSSFTNLSCFLALISGPLSSFLLRGYFRYKNNKKPEHTPTFKDWIKVFKVKQIYPLFIAISAAIGVATSIIFLFRMLFCPNGYSQTESDSL